MFRIILINVLVSIVTLANGCTLKKAPDSDLRTNERGVSQGDPFHSKPVGWDNFELRKRIPLVLLCQKRRSIDTSKPFDLVFRLRDFESRKYSQITTDLNVIDSWDVNTKEIEEHFDVTSSMYFHRKRPEDGKFLNFVYRPAIETSGYAWYSEAANPNGPVNSENYMCAHGSKLSERSPKIAEELIISGRDTSGKYVHHPISVDWLYKDEKDGREKILSKSKAHEGWAVVGEPVFNKNNEVVGFVETYSPGHSFGITIRSVHDPKFGTEVNDWVAQKNWKPIEPLNNERGPSRSIMTTCHCIARDAKPPKGALDGFYRACQSYAKYGYP